jgi:hypothetical protein
MIFDIGGRQNGKTTRLLEFLDKVPGSILVVPSEDRRRFVRRAHRIDERRIVTVQDLQLGRVRGWDTVDTKWIVDDLDMILPLLLGLNGGEVALVAAHGKLENAGRADG